ncbi:MAG: ThiF family adenylyltransferase [Candidatus Woesearchaeota archaeon]
MKKALIIGIGTLGSRVALLAQKEYSLTLLDRDIVEEHNIGRQKIFSKKDVGFPKAIAAAKILNCDYVVTDVIEAQPDFSSFDIILECLDNNEARIRVVESAFALGVPLVHSSAEANVGEVMTIPPGHRIAGYWNKKDSPGCDSEGIDERTADKVTRLMLDVSMNLQQWSLTPILYRMRNGHMRTFSVRDCIPSRSTRNERTITRLCGGTWHVRGLEYSWNSLYCKHKGEAASFSSEHITLGDCTFFKDGRILVKKNEKKEIMKSIQAWM